MARRLARAAAEGRTHVSDALPHVTVVAADAADAGLDAQRYPRVACVRPGAAMGGGLAVHLDSGDRLLPDALWRVARAHLRHPDAALYAGNGILLARDGAVPFRSGPPSVDRPLLRLDDVFAPAAFVTVSAGETAAAAWRPAVEAAARRGRAVLIADPLASRAVAQRPASRAAEPPDPGDVVDLPFAAGRVPSPRRTGGPTWISVVTPSFNQGHFLAAALDSVLAQGLPDVETIVRDGGSTDGSVELLRGYGARLTRWTSEKDAGPAAAINAGFREARGEVLSWLSSDDLLAEDALASVAEAFADDPSLDLVYGNALYVDADGRPAAPLHGGVPTPLYFGALQPAERVPFYWTYVHSLPQPAVFFRRRLLEACGGLDQSLHHVFDFELFWRFVRHGARAKKIEKTLAFYRLHADAKSSAWRPFLVELYRITRGSWPPFGSRAFRETLGGFVRDYRRRRSGDGPNGLAALTLAGLAGASALSGIGNPEALGRRRPHQAAARLS
jgi:glycosyltransferase involved in cell wall biosynthesis